VIFAQHVLRARLRLRVEDGERGVEQIVGAGALVAVALSQVEEGEDVDVPGLDAGGGGVRMHAADLVDVAGRDAEDLVLERVLLPSMELSFVQVLRLEDAVEVAKMDAHGRANAQLLPLGDLPVELEEVALLYRREAEVVELEVAAVEILASILSVNL
jgi:hypothetical protein